MDILIGDLNYIMADYLLQEKIVLIDTQKASASLQLILFESVGIIMRISECGFKAGMPPVRLARNLMGLSLLI